MDLFNISVCYRQREMRHQQNRRSSDDDSDRSHSRSSSRYNHCLILLNKVRSDFNTTNIGVFAIFLLIFYRESVSNDKKREDKSKSRSASPRIPVWEPNREPASTSQRPRPSEYGENSYYPDTRRRYQEPEAKEDRRNDEERSQHYSNRYEKYPNREQGQGSRYDSYNRYENQNYDGRWKEESYIPGRRRPYGHRGGYKGHGFRHGEHSHGSSPSQDYDREAAEAYARSKVKLVDY